METSPYQTPQSELGHTSSFKRSIWWKIYFFFITIVSAVGMLSFFLNPNVGIAEYIYLPVWVVATVGLFGFVFVKSFYRPQFWLVFLIAYIAFAVIYYFITRIDQRAGMGDAEFYIVTAVSWLLTLPTFFAIYFYSKPTNPAWDNA